MSRRLYGVAAFTAGLVVATALPFLGSAHAAACPAWTDPSGDGTPVGLAQPAASNAGLDIVAATLGSVGSDLVATIKVTTLNPSANAPGDRFAVAFTIGTQNLRLVTTRDAARGTLAAVENTTTTTAPKGVATATFTAATNTVTISAKQAEVDKPFGAATAGQSTKISSARSELQAGDLAVQWYDDARPATGTTLMFTIGESCGDTVPVPGPPLPDGFPKAGCDTIADGKSDGRPTPVNFTTNGVTPGQMDNDPDLDITGVAINTTATDLKAFLHIDKLAMPKNTGGHQFSLSFTLNSKAVVIHVGENDANGKALESTAGSPNWGTVNSQENVNATATPTFDKTNNFVIVSIALDKLATAVGGTLTPGTTLTALTVTSAWYADPAQDTITADTVQAADAANRKYAIGDNTCFPPPPGILTNTGKTTAQYTDAAAVAAKLTNAAGTALGSKTVTFKVGSKTVSVKTGTDGVAKASLNPGLVVGSSYSLVTSFAGDASASAVSITTPFSVSIEKTKLTLSVVKSGSKRTVYAKLLDDDKHPVAGQVVTWYINGKRVSAPRTNSSGVATLTTAKPTQTVKAVFATVSGKYVTSSAQMKV